MNYEADKTVQMRVVYKPGRDSTLDIHEMREDGHPRCGKKQNSWKGHTMRPVALGRATVTCLSCIRKHEREIAG